MAQLWPFVSCPRMGHENFCKIVNGTPVEEPAWKSRMEFPMRKIEGRRRQESDSRASISWKKWFGVRKGWSHYRDIWFELWSFENFVLEIYLFFFRKIYENFVRWKGKNIFVEEFVEFFFFSFGRRDSQEISFVKRHLKNIYVICWLRNVAILWIYISTQFPRQVDAKFMIY